MSFEADDKHVYDLFTKRCYGTPRNQRQYVWNKRNWQELFDDVLLVATGKEATHFIGSIVLYKENDRKNGISYFTIVDGQQRIISLTIFLASVAFCLHCYEFDDEFRGTKQYLFTRDDLNQETMVIKSEQYIALERIITGLFSISPNMAKCFETVALVKQYSRNNKNLAAAFVFFINSIYKHIEESTLSPIQVLLNLRTAITDNLLYVDITASSEEDAYTIFEILNARGSALEGHELLKNFILRGIRPDGDVDTAKTTWSEIEPLFRKVSAIINSFVIPTKAFQLFRFLTIFIRSPSTTTVFFLLLNLRNLQTVRMLNLKYMLFSKSIGKNKFVLSF